MSNLKYLSSPKGTKTELKIITIQEDYSILSYRFILLTCILYQHYHLFPNFFLHLQLLKVCLILSFIIIISRILDPSTQIWHGTLHICCQSKTSVNGFQELELENLKKIYMYLYPLIRSNKIKVSPSYVRYSGLAVHGNVFGSSESKYWRSSYIAAHWVGNDGNISSHAKLCQRWSCKMFWLMLILSWYIGLPIASGSSQCKET